MLHNFMTKKIHSTGFTQWVFLKSTECKHNFVYLKITPGATFKGEMSNILPELMVKMFKN